MPSRSSFQDGFSFFEKNIGVVDGAYGASRYVSGVEEKIDSFAKELNVFGLRRKNSGPKQLQGDVAEYWHAHTFNIEAKAAESTHHAEALRSNRLASVDIKTNFGEEYSLKYRGNGEQSGKEQLSETVYERFKRSEMDSLEDFLNKKKLEGKDPNLSLYQGQGRIVPSDQLSEAAEYLKKRYNKEAYNRPEQAAKYQEPLEQLDDRIRDGEGIESHPLSRPDSEKLTVEAQKGNVDAECLKQYGVSLEEIVKCEYVFKQAMEAGKTAAVITTVMKLAPEVLNTVSYLVKTGRLNSELFKKMGLAALDGASLGFIRGSVAAGITTACKAGFFGAAMKSLTPSVIASLTVLTMETIGDAFHVACGQKDRQEMALNLIKNMVVSSSGLIGGGLASCVLPCLGFMLGSFIGATLGSFACKAGGTAVLSLCVDTGFTMFGLVDQNHELPQEVLDELGVKSFQVEPFRFNEFNGKSFDLGKFQTMEFAYDSFRITVLRRGVVSVSKIGYV